MNQLLANVLKFSDKEDVRKTIKFVTYFDKFFDSLNVMSLHAGKHKRKPFQLPYTSADDSRLTVRYYMHVVYLF